MSFENIYCHGFARVCAVTGPVVLGDPLANAEHVVASVRRAHEQGAALVVFPELYLTGYTVDDLFLSDTLHRNVERALVMIARETARFPTLILVGAPLRVTQVMYNCAVAIQRGKILGANAKMNLPNYGEFYEHRYFKPMIPWGQVDLEFAGQEFTVGSSLMFHATDLPDFCVTAELCEDLWVARPAAHDRTEAGATIVANLSSSPITVGRARERHLLCRSSSYRTHAAWLYCAAGAGESTTDLAWDGQAMIYEDGQLLAENQRFSRDVQFTYADVDLGAIKAARRRQTTFSTGDADGNSVPFSFGDGDCGSGEAWSAPLTATDLRRQVDRFPFVPSDPAALDEDCFEAYHIQVAGLVERLRATGNARPVIGVSGGLDSTQALLVCAQAMDQLGRPREDILAVTMPGFATSEHTKSNARALCEQLGTDFLQIDIRPAAKQMLSDIGHPFGRGEEVYDVTFENVQAGLRTDFLFRLANDRGGIVVGTGDLSELALGWCTFGVGDHMSHYSVNPGIPKTMMQYLIGWVIDRELFGASVGEILRSILDTEITPELIPTREGERPQSTQSSIGPYALHDFTLFYFLRGFCPRKIAFLAYRAWGDCERGSWPAGREREAFDLPTILKWLRVFLRRFFANQFKRSTLPNGPKVLGGGALSPRGDWRMPADMSGGPWVKQVEDLAAELGIDLDR